MNSTYNDSSWQKFSGLQVHTANNSRIHRYTADFSRADKLPPQFPETINQHSCHISPTLLQTPGGGKVRGKGHIVVVGRTICNGYPNPGRWNGQNTSKTGRTAKLIQYLPIGFDLIEKGEIVCCIQSIKGMELLGTLANGCYDGFNTGDFSRKGFLKISLIEIKPDG